MPPKKRRKGKKGKKEKNQDTDALTAVDRTFYELTITDLNNKLARLRSHCSKLEGTSEDLTDKLRQFEEDRTDVTAYLEKQLNEKINIIKEMDERIIELEQVRNEENKGSDDKIKEWEIKYKAMYDQLTSEVKLLNGKLNSLEEFRSQRGELLMKFDEQEAEMKEQRRKQQETIQEMEQKAIIEKDQLKRDVEAKLAQLSEDFTKSSEIRIAGYTRRLIRENIALNKEMDQMIATEMQMEKESNRMKERAKEVEALIENSETVKQRLMKTCQNQIEIIENLTQQYETLQAKYHKITHYKKLYETSLKRDICDRFSFNEMGKKLRILAQRVEMLKIDKQKLISFHQQHEAEIIRLNDILKNIKFTVQSAIRGEVDPSDHPEFREVQRKNLLSEIMNIITSYTEEPTFAPSVSSISSAPSAYRPGLVGLTPKTTISLFELFKREARKIASAELLTPGFKAKTRDGKIIPKERSVDGETLIDAEASSIIVCSSSTVEDEPPPPPDDGLDDEQGDLGEATESTESIASLTRTARKKNKSLTSTSDEAIAQGGKQIGKGLPEKDAEKDTEDEDHRSREMVGSDIDTDEQSVRIETQVEDEQEEEFSDYFVY